MSGGAGFATCVVTVTYGRRVHLLERVLDAALECRAVHALVVANGLPLSERAKLEALRERLGPQRVSVVDLPVNEGSAGGFHAGLKVAAEREDIDFLWVLDDDTAPERGALDALIAAWKRLGGSKRDALMSLRTDRRVYQKALARGTLHWIEPDAFFDFNFAHLWNGGQRRARREAGCLELGVAAYGGLWLARDWIDPGRKDRIALPPEHFHLYFDDYAFTAQIPAHGGRLWLCPDSRLRDLDASWQAQRRVCHPWLDPRTEERRVFCTIRNRLWVELPRVRRRGRHRINMALYCLVKVIGPSMPFLLRNLGRAPDFIRRLRLIARALREGFSKRGRQSGTAGEPPDAYQA